VFNYVCLAFVLVFVLVLYCYYILLLLYIYYYILHIIHTLSLLYILSYTILFSPSSSSDLSSNLSFSSLLLFSPLPHIHSILVGTYMRLFIFHQDIYLPSLLFFCSIIPSTSLPLFLLSFILYLSVLTSTYLYSSIPNIHLLFSSFPL
jgi:hypothetical protein